MSRGARTRAAGASAAVRVVLLSSAAWSTQCSYPEDYYPPSDDGGGGASATNDSGGGGDDGGEGAASTSSSGGSSGSGTSSGSGSSGSGGSSGDGGPVVHNPGIPGPMVTFDDFSIPQPNGDVAAPGAICAGPDGRIWFLHQTTAPSSVGAMTVDGQNVGLLTNSITNIGPIAINPGPDGNVWYTKQGGTGKVTPSALPSTGSPVVMMTGYQEFGAPQGAETGGIIQGPDGNMWYTTTTPAQIVKMDTNGQSTPYAISGSGRTPAGIASGPDGNLWYTDTTANVIGRITPSGTITEYPIPTAASFPKAICGGPKGDGNIWFVEHDAHNIGRITPSGTITEFAIPSGGEPSAIAAGPDGNLWFTEPGAFNAVGRCTPSGGISEYPLPTAGTEVSGITAGPDGNMWFSEEYVAKIGRFSNLMGGGNLASGMVGQTPLGGTVTMCNNDIDCINSGKACGGDVCSWLVTPHVCVLANTGDPGWCSQNSDCWCNAPPEMATCDTTSHHCSITTPDGYDGG